MSKPILVMDFDGVIHSYTTKWSGVENCPDPPVPGAMDFLRRAREHFSINVLSTRSHQDGGIPAMLKYFDKWAPDLTENIIFPKNYKPPAHCTIDDRAFQFNGTFPDLEVLLSFKPWNKR